ncbi:sulfite exporter TauE/SafE family protein [Chloroflexota bacterium]
MTFPYMAIAVLAILIASTALSMVGVGGGVLYVPILLALGMSFHEAATISLFVILATSISAFIMYRRRSFVDWKLALAIEPPTFIMALAGGIASNYISESPLKIVFAAVLIVASIFMIRPTVEKQSITAQKWGYWRRTVGDTSYVARLPGLMPATTLAGFVAGMIGISGGIFKMPAMVLIGNVPIRIAIGTSSLMVAATATAGLIGHTIGGSFHIMVMLPLAVAAFAGGRLGATLSIKVKAGILRRFFAVLLLLVSAWLIINEVIQHL